MSIHENKVSYVIVAQNARDKLILATADRKIQFIRSAHEILLDKEMLRGFSPEHASIIGVVAGMAISESGNTT